MESLPDRRSFAGLAEVGLYLHHKPKIGSGKLLRSRLGGNGAEAVEGTLHDMRRFQIVGGGVRVSRVVIVGVELHTRDVLLKESDRHRTGKLLAPSPNQIEPAAEHSGEC